MKKEKDFFEELRLLGIVPVVKIERADQAVPLARALLAGGLLCAEITFRTAAAEEAIRRISEEVPELLVGAGTVLTPEQVKRAVGAGAKFIVSPGLSQSVVKACCEQNVPVTPGVATATEIQQALELGLTVLKFFPAEANGGLKTLKALAAPFGQVKFIPTGGVNAENLLPYLKTGSVLAVGGSWMVKSDWISGGQWETIQNLSRQAVAKMLGFRLKEVQFAVENPVDTEHLLDRLVNAENGPVLRSGSDTRVVLYTHFVERARFYLKRWGWRVSQKPDGLHVEGLGLEFILVEESPQM